MENRLNKKRYIKIIFWLIVALVVFIILKILKNIFEFNLGTINWDTISAIASVVLLIAIFIQSKAIKEQAEATKKMAEYQIMPFVDVKMIYIESDKKTYFGFFNPSDILALVTIDVSFYDKNESIIWKHPSFTYQIEPKIQKNTTNTFFDDKINSDIYKEGVKAKLSIIIKPDIENIPSDVKVIIFRSYNFHYDPITHTNKWVQKKWGDSDYIIPR